MPDPPSAATPNSSGPLFILKETVTVVIGKQTVHLYPRCHPLMPIKERAHAFHITTTALQSLHLPSDVYLDNIGMYLDSATTIAGLKFDFMDHFHEHWLDMHNLSIISFHNSAGVAMDTATVAGDPALLKPVQHGPMPQCCPADVCFVRLELTLDFRELCTAAAANKNTVLRTNYYLELPQTTDVVNDGDGNPRNLTTFHGTADLRTLSCNQIEDEILSHVPHGGPIPDDASAMDNISRSILKLSVKTAEELIFAALCPNYTSKPHAAVKGLSQTTVDEEGNPMILPVAQFHSILNRSSQTFAHMKTYPVCICTIFMRGLHADVKSVFEELYPAHNDPISLEGRVQRTTLATLLCHATSAENRVLNTQKLVACPTRLL